ncbi:hypothetical protein [Pseudogracilibacillus auburnensis]|uniref:hypothetical protein n=1 Tax=Pseudogracilibacillus auburnensis TaxID=1494959 RepID=UPI001A95C311|nr:hypothetical protein [Pseudogracilibacillus auburnensis]MBO1005961.1 hypothetical protein [Pseudogracilibacillus auburnensis]
MKKLLFPLLVAFYISINLVAFSSISAKPKTNENVIEVNETKQYKQTEITLEKVVIAEDKLKIMYKLNGTQVKDLVVGKKGKVYMHTLPIVKVFDNYGKSLKEGGIGEVGKAKGQPGILARIHNISEEMVDYTNYYQKNDNSPNSLRIQIMEFSEKASKEDIAAEFRVEIK